MNPFHSTFSYLTPDSGSHRNITGNLVLMNTEEKDFGFLYPMFGAVSDVQVWDKVLSDDSLVQWASCQRQIEGNVLSWSRAVLQVTALSVVHTDMREGVIHF